jgi:hypothetical protein
MRLVTLFEAKRRQSTCGMSAQSVAKKINFKSQSAFLRGRGWSPWTAGSIPELIVVFVVGIRLFFELTVAPVEGMQCLWHCIPSADGNRQIIPCVEPGSWQHILLIIVARRVVAIQCMALNIIRTKSS